MNKVLNKLELLKSKSIKQTFVDNSGHFGKTIQEIFEQLVEQSSLVSSGAVYVINSAKTTVNIPTFSASAYFGGVSCDGLATPTCASPASSNINEHTIGYRVLTMCNFSYVDSLCKENYIDLFDQNGIFEAFSGAMNFEVKAQILDLYMSRVGKEISLKMEDGWLNGDVTITPDCYNYHLTSCDGILVKMKNDVNVIHVDGYLTPGATLTSVNILTELQAIYDAIPDTLLKNHAQNSGDMGLYIAVSFTAMRLLQQAFSASTGFFLTNKAFGANLDPATAAIVSNLTVSGTGATFYGIPIIYFNQMPANTIYVSYARNIVYGADSISDYSTLQVIPEYMYDSKKMTIGIRMLMRMGNQFVFPADIVHRY